MVEATINTNGREPESGEGSDLKPQGGDSQPQRIGGFELLSPGDIVGDGINGDAPRKRKGRPKGSRNASPSTEKTQNTLIANLESLLLSVHFMGAKILEVPEIELDEQEAKMLSDCLRKVAEFYPVSLSPKRMAMAELAICAGTIYGPRIVTIYKKAPKGPKLVPSQPQQTQQQPVQAAAASRPVAPSSTPRVPSDMWNQDGQETASDQA